MAVFCARRLWPAIRGLSRSTGRLDTQNWRKKRNSAAWRSMLLSWTQVVSRCSPTHELERVPTGRSRPVKRRIELYGSQTARSTSLEITQEEVEGEYLACPATNRIPAAGQHQGSTSAIRTATNALVAN